MVACLCAGASSGCPSCAPPSAADDGPRSIGRGTVDGSPTAAKTTTFDGSGIDGEADREESAGYEEPTQVGPQEDGMMREPVLQGDAGEESDVERALRPRVMADMVGQRDVYARLQIAVTAAIARQDALGHV